MAEPIFWLGLSLLLVAVSLTTVMVAALPVLQELGRAARSAEKLFDTLARELPPTLESIRLTGLEISDLTDDISESVQSAGEVVKQVDRSLSHVKRQAYQANLSTRGLVVGLKAAWRSLRTSSSQPKFPEGSRSQRQYYGDYGLAQRSHPQPPIQSSHFNDLPEPEASPSAPTDHYSDLEH